MSQMAVHLVLICYGELLNIGHYLLMVRKGISPTPISIKSGKPFDHVTATMHERAIIYYMIAET